MTDRADIMDQLSLDFLRQVLEQVDYDPDAPFNRDAIYNLTSITTDNPTILQDLVNDGVLKSFVYTYDICYDCEYDIQQIIDYNTIKGE